MLVRYNVRSTSKSSLWADEADFAAKMAFSAANGRLRAALDCIAPWLRNVGPRPSRGSQREVFLSDA